MGERRYRAGPSKFGVAPYKTSELFGMGQIEVSPATATGIALATSLAVQVGIIYFMAEPVFGRRASVLQSLALAAGTTIGGGLILSLASPAISRAVKVRQPA